MTRRSRYLISIVAIFVVVIATLLTYYILAFGPMVRVQYTRFELSYSGASGSCFIPPVHQTITEPITVTRGENFTENLYLNAVVNNVVCRLNSVEAMTAGFSITLVQPTLPITLRPNQTLDLTLTVQTSSSLSFFSGPLDIQLLLNSTRL